MSAQKRIVITDQTAIKRLNLMAAILETDASELATQGANMLWEKKQEEVMAGIGEMSPVANHLTRREEVSEELPKEGISG